MGLEVNKKKYRAFCEDIEDLPIFFYDWYLDAVVEHGKWDVVLLEQAGQVVGAWPYFEKQQLGLRYISMPLFTKYMGPILSKHITDQEHAQACIAQLSNKMPKFAGIDQQWAPRMSNLAVSQSHAFKLSEYVTYRIDLKQEWQQNINRNMRRNIKKAEKTLRLVHSDDLARFYELNKMSFDRQGIAIPYSFEQLKRHDDALAQQQARQFFFAIDEEEKIHSAAYLIWDKHSAYYHLSGDNPSLRKSGSGIWLIAKAIAYAQEALGLSVFDFEGSMIPAVAAIRQQFGAQAYSYYRAQQTKSIVYKALKRLKS